MAHKEKAEEKVLIRVIHIVHSGQRDLSKAVEEESQWTEGPVQG